MFDCPRCAESPRGRILRMASAALCVLLLASCGLRQSRLRAEQAVREFHALLNKGQYDAIYNDSDAALKKAWTRADFTAYLASIHSRLGMAGTSATRGYQVNASTTSGTEVALSVETRFDDGTAQERFVWRIEGDRAVLLDYRADITPAPGPRTV
jgi:hypothetical protein